jgi:uncharacterized protein YjbI with pentapeptide repeats
MEAYHVVCPCCRAVLNQANLTNAVLARAVFTR